jgi:hypothetical protein
MEITTDFVPLLPRIYARRHWFQKGMSWKGKRQKKQRLGNDFEVTSVALELMQ